MKNRGLYLALAIPLLLLGARTAVAQTATTGAIRGVVTDDSAGGANVAGATVVATSPALQGTRSALTDESGSFTLDGLPPGTYSVTVFYGDGQWKRDNVLVRLGKVSIANIAIDSSKAAAGETITIEGRAPLVDQGSTKTGVTIDESYTRNIPTGRTFQGTLGAAAGSQGDAYGVSFGGSTSAENVYIINGINVTDPAYGGVTTNAGGAVSTTNLPNEFLSETEVITGGYNAEYGRSTGAVVNVLTKSGGNEVHGSVFSYITLGALSPTPRVLPREGSSISTRAELDYSTSIGAEVGGPIVKDKVWYHVGLNPVFSSNTITRMVSTFVDEDNDGNPDVDENGFSITRELSSHDLSTSNQQLLFDGKLSFLVSPEHQGAVSVMGNPGKSDTLRTVSGPARSGRYDLSDGAFDSALRWTSKFDDSKTQLDLTAGFHRGRAIERPSEPGGHDPQVRFDYDLPLADLAAYEEAYGGVPAGCMDGTADDPYPNIDNCPVQFYNTGGLGFRETNETDRLAAAAKLSQRVKLAGHHQFKLGADIEQLTYRHLSDFTGGKRFRYREKSIRVDRFFTVRNDGDTPCGDDLNGDGEDDAKCVFMPDGLRSETTTRSLAAFVQDSWAIRPNLTLNAGLRWERQDAFVADHIVGQISPTTGEPIPDKAFTINNMLAPRVGVIYDWTEQGRSKVFGHWGRFYEMVPMDINARAYGGEVFAVDVLLPSSCTPTSEAIMQPNQVRCNFEESVINRLLGGGEEVVVPKLKGQYLDEAVAGLEYEVLEDLKVGATYIHRELGRIIEDVSVDGGNSYIVANPGEAVSASDIQKIRDEAAAARMECADPNNCPKAAFLENQANSFEGVNRFDPPERRYDGLQLSVEKRFSKDLMVIGSYTYSRLRGNFPGLFSPDTGQLDPNLTSMYDLPDLMANRYGPLPHDKPHLLKLDGYYLYDGGSIGRFVFGGSVRAASGRPVNTLGGHSLYGFGESYILPRGTAAPGTSDRTPTTFSVDTRVTYGRKLSDGMLLEAFVDVFNLFNSETTLSVDENYTFDNVNPIVGGDKEDVKHAKALDDAAGGLPTARVVKPNPNYGNPTSDMAVRSIRFGLRLTF